MNRLALVIASIGLFGVALVPGVRADEWNKMTILTVNEPIQVPNRTLEPGKYVMRLMDSPSNRHIVQIFDSTQQHLITTVLAIPNYRLEPTGKTVFTFWETPPGQPKALRAWFYPGDNFGQEFAYPKMAAVAIASAAHANVLTTEAQTESEYRSAEVGTVNEQGEEKPMEEQQQVAQAAPPPAPAPTPAPAPEAAPAPSPVPETLPHTGSTAPLIGLAGMLSLGIFGLLRAVRWS
jgi:LPXTG-motif cell wall-anchored protein